MREINDTIIIIVTNLVALLIAFYSHSIAFILLFYWLENAVIGLFNILKMLVCDKDTWGKLFNIPFFIMHYGVFMTVHLIFLVYIISLVGEKNVFTLAGMTTILSGFIALIISHGIRFIREEVSGEFKDKNSGYFMSKPYLRIIIMHMTIIFGTILYSILGKPFYIVLLIIVLKTIAELYSEHIKLFNSIKKITNQQ